METLKFRLLKRVLFLLPVSALLLSSCEEEQIDIRDEFTGSYEYEVKLYVEEGNDLVYIGDQGSNYDLTGTMRVVKNTGSMDVVDFYDGNVLMFQGINVAEAGNAIVFDIPEQEGWVGPVNVQITGYDYWEVGSSSYHGAFLYEDESLEIAFEARIMDAFTGMVMIMTAWRD